MVVCFPCCFSRYLYKAGPNTDKAVPPLRAGNQELWQDGEGFDGELGPLQGLHTKSPCFSPNTSVQRAQFLNRPPVGEELAAMGPETKSHIWASGPEALPWPVLYREKRRLLLPTAQGAQPPPPHHCPSSWSVLLWVLWLSSRRNTGMLFPG